MLKYNLPVILDSISGLENVICTVVDSNSSDDTLAYLKTLPVKSLGVNKCGLSLARNLAISHHQGDYLIFLDDDARPSSSFFDDLFAIVDSFNPEIIGGAIIPEIGTEFPDWFCPSWEVRMKSKYSGFTKDITFSGSNLIVRSDVFSKIGTFDTNLGMVGNKIKFGEEHDFMNRYFVKGGTRAFYDPKLVVYHTIIAYKLTFFYRFKREIAPINQINFKDKIAFLVMKDSYLKVLKRYFRYRKIYNFSPEQFLDRFLFNFLLIIRSLAKEMRIFRQKP